MSRIYRSLLVVSAIGLTAPAAGFSQAPAKEETGPGKHQQMQGMMPGMEGMMQEMQGMMQDMMGIHAYAPATLLDQKAELGLSGTQVSKLEKLAADVKTAKAHAKAEHDVRHARIVAEFKLAQPDPAKVKADAQEAMTDKAAAHGIEISAFAQAKALLTDAQRAKVDAGVTHHQKMMKTESGHGSQH